MMERIDMTETETETVTINRVEYERLLAVEEDR